MTGVTLLTGADGHIGRRLAAALLDGTDDALVLAVRAGSAEELRTKRRNLIHLLGHGAAGRAAVTAADLRHDGALDGVDPRRITRIVHAAAVTSFTVDRETAQAVNAAGTARVCDFAARCGRLERFAVLSTLYTAGRQRGQIGEVRHGESGFVNHYEWSKWAAEEHALATRGDLPLSILRLPTIIADDDSGYVSQYNAVHNTLKLYFYGLLSLVPGDPGTPLSLATSEFACSAVTHLIGPRGPHGIVHVCPDPADTATLGPLIDQAFTVFERSETFRRRRLLRPLFCDQDSFDDLVDAAQRMRGGPIHQSLSSVAPFAAQLHLPKTFHNDALRAAWPGYAAPEPLALIEAVCHHLVESRWGRRIAEAA